MSRSLYSKLHHRYGRRVSGAEREHQIATRLEAFNSEFSEDFDPTTLDVTRKSLKVIVVGGGFAGLMAAQILAARHKTIVFEARERVGGRVHTITDPHNMRLTEAGAELIGYAHPTWLTLAKRYGLGFSVWSSDGAFDALKLETPLVLGGRLLTRKENIDTYDEMNDKFKGMIEDAKRLRDPNRPWEDASLKELDNMPLSAWIANQRCSELCQKAMEVNFANTNGAPTNQQSYLANLALVKGAASPGNDDAFFTSSENIRCESGNDDLAKHLAQDICRMGGEVRLSRPVTQIAIKGAEVQVTDSDGKQEPADIVVLAIPPSLWCDSPQSGKCAVGPDIFQNYRITMGTAVKYLSQCPGRFWISEGFAPSGASEECGMTWEGTDNQMQLTGQNIGFSLFAGGDAANSAIREFDRDVQAGRRFYDVRIQKLYKSYGANRQATQFVCWPQKEWTMTGYSCPAPGDVFKVASKLADPFQDRIYFAGEHTCLPFFGYMEGALQSGRRVARAISRL
jgi:monoamine oxidase